MSRYYDTLNLADSLRINNTSVIDSSRNLTNIATISVSGDSNIGGLYLGGDGSYGSYDCIGFSGNTNGHNRIFGYSTTGGGMYVTSASNQHIHFRTNGGTADQLRITSDNQYQHLGTTWMDGSRNATFTGLSVGGGAYTTRFFTNTNDSRVLKLRDRSNNVGNIIQFEEYNGANTWEVVGRKEGTYPFYIYKNWGNGSGYKLTIDQNGHGKWYSGDFDVRTGNLRVGASVNSINGYQVNGTTVIDSNRNLTNIGVIKGGQVSVDVNTYSLDIYPTADGTAATGGWARSLNFRNSASGTQRGHFGALGSADSIDYIFMSIGSDETDYTSNDFRVYSDRVYTGNRVDAGYYQVGGTTVIDSSRNLTNIGTIASGSITASGNVNAYNHDVSAGNGNGVRFWNGSDSYSIKMAHWSDRGRVSGETTSDYNMYFRMQGGGTNRGFVFETNGGRVAGIDGGGTFRTVGQIRVGEGAASSYIWMNDSDNGGRYIHCNSNRVGFLTSASAWGSWSNDDGSWQTAVAYGINNTTVIDSSRNGYLKSLRLDTGNNLEWGGEYGSGYPTIAAAGSSASGFLAFYPTGNTNGETVRFNSAGINAKVGGYQINGTTVIDANRNAFFGETVELGNINETNQKLNIKYRTNSSGYGAVRFYENTSNRNTIHSFSSTWQSGSLSSTSTDAINISGGTGVTFGAWNNVSAYITNAGDVSAKNSLQINGTTVIDSSRNALNLNSIQFPSLNGQVAMSLNDGALHLRSFADKYHKIWYYDGIAFGTNSAHGHFRFYAETNTQRNASSGGAYLRFDIDSVTGNCTASGNITAYSDIKLKKNIETITSPLDKVTKLRGVTYNRKDQDDNKLHMGVIAQEVEKVIPEVVDYQAETDTKTVSYGNMVGLLIEAIKELKQEIEVLKNGTNSN